MASWDDERQRRQIARIDAALAPGRPAAADLKRQCDEKQRRIDAALAAAQRRGGASINTTAGAAERSLSTLLAGLRDGSLDAANLGDGRCIEGMMLRSSGKTADQVRQLAGVTGTPRTVATAPERQRRVMDGWEAR